MKTLLTLALLAGLFVWVLADPCETITGRLCVGGSPPGKPFCQNGYPPFSYQYLYTVAKDEYGCFGESMMCRRSSEGDCNVICHYHADKKVFLILDKFGNPCGRTTCDENATLTPTGTACDGTKCGTIRHFIAHPIYLKA